MVFERLSRLLRARRQRGLDARAGMSAQERKFVDERVEDRQAEGFAEEHLGGLSPGRMLDGDEPDAH